MSICDKCVHREVCCDEGMGEEALNFCAHLLEERPKGKWIFNEKMYHQYCCSECGLPMPAVNDYYRAKIIGCPYCLADMRGEENG